MKKVRGKFFQCFLATVLIATTVIQGGVLDAKASTSNFGVGNHVYQTTSDKNTDIPMTTGKVEAVAGFGEEEADGRIWVDKSVTDKEDGSFNVKLSALTQEFTSTKTGSSESSTAADVTFILDGSGSMGDKDAKDIVDGDGPSLYRLQAMIKATNEAIDIIMKANPKNRIAVYWYSGDGNTTNAKVQTVLKMNTYTNNGSSDYFRWGKDVWGSHGYEYLVISPDLKDSDGNKPDSNPDGFFVADGGTPTQNGLAYALDSTIDNIEKGLNQGERKPYVFLLSDGGATLGNKKWYDIDEILGTNSAYKIGNGEETGDSAQLDEVTANLILTGAYMKDQLNDAYKIYNEKYGYAVSKAKLYSVGLGSNINGPYIDAVNKKGLKYAWIGLQPSAIETAINDKTGTYEPERQTAAQNVEIQLEAYVDAAVTATNDDTLKKYKDRASYTYSDYYTYADNYANLQKAFTDLARDIESETKVVQSPVEVDKKSQSSIFYHTIGAGMELKEPFTITKGTETLTGKLATSSIQNTKTYIFDDFDGKVVVNLENGVAKSVDWYIAGKDLKDAMYTMSNGGYTSKPPLTLDYDLRLSSNLDTNTNKTFYTNTITTTNGNVEADTYVTFTPTKDNPYYFYTNPSSGKIAKLEDIGFLAEDTDITHYVKGEKITDTTDLTAIKNVYVTIDMANASGGLIPLKDVGTVLADLPTEAELASNTLAFKQALSNSIENCKRNSKNATDDGDNTYAFLIGIQKEHEHIVNKDADANLSGTTTYLSKEHFENGLITMKLGNNGRAIITHDITKSTSNTLVVPGDTITYTIKVNNDTTQKSTGVTVSDDYPAGLTEIKNLSAIGTFSTTGTNVTWENVEIPANSSVTLSFSAKVPSETAVGQYKNQAKITQVNNTTVTNPAISNQATSEVKEGIKIAVNKDGIAWNDSGKTFVLKDASGNEFKLNDSIPNGKYTIFDGTTNTNVTIDIAERSGTATLDYYTLKLNAGVGISEVKETSNTGVAGNNSNEYVFLKGQTANISATVADSRYEFVDWTGVSGSSLPANKADVTTSVVINSTTTLMAKAKEIVSEITIDAKLNDGTYPNFDKEVTFVEKTTGAIITDLTKVPNGDYIVHVDGEPTTIEFTADGSDKSITLEYYTLTVEGGTGITGTLGSGNYIKGSKVSIEAYLENTYHFDKWTGSITNETVNKNSVVVNGKMTVTASAVTPPKEGVNIIITPKLDGGTWADVTKVFTIQDVDGNVIDPSNVKAGTYTIYDNGVSTGETIVVTQEMITANTDVAITLNYYSLLLNRSEGIKSVKETNQTYVFLEGETANITALLENNYQFTGWTDGSGTVTYENVDTSIVMDKPIELTATAKDMYKVNVDVRLDGSVYVGFVENITLKDSNGNVITDLSSVPNGDYTVYVNGEETYAQVTVDKNSPNVYLEYFTVTLDKGEGIDTVSGGGIYMKGETVPIHATPQEGYVFKDWTGSKTLDKQETNIQVDGTMYYKANAEKENKDHKISIDVYKDGKAWTDHGKTVTLVNANGTTITDLSKVKDGSYTVYVNGVATDITAYMDGEDATLKLEYFTLTLDKGEGIHTISGDGIYRKGETVSIRATLQDGYQFKNWTGSKTLDQQETSIQVDGTLYYKANAEKKNKDHQILVDIYKDGEVWTDHGKTVTLVDEKGNTISDLSKVKNGSYTVYVNGIATNITARMNGEDTTLRLEYFTVTLDKGTGIDSVNGSGVYLAGSSVVIHANMSEGYLFSGWKGTSTYPNSSQTIVVSQKMTLTANATKNTNGIGTDTYDSTLTSLYMAFFVTSGLILVCIGFKKRMRHH